MNSKEIKWIEKLKTPIELRTLRLNSITFALLSLAMFFTSIISKNKLWFVSCAEIYYIVALLFFYNYYKRLGTIFVGVDGNLAEAFNSYLLDSNTFGAEKTFYKKYDKLIGYSVKETSNIINTSYYKFCETIICWFLFISVISIFIIVKFWRNYMELPYLIAMAVFMPVTYIAIIFSRKHIEKIITANKDINTKLKRIDEI